MCWSLQSIKITEGIKAQNENLLTTIHNYMQKYSQEHKVSGLVITCRDVIAECHRLLEKKPNDFSSSNLRIKQNFLTMLLRETEMLEKFGTGNKLHSYTKATQV